MRYLFSLVNGGIMAHEPGWESCGAPLRTADGRTCKARRLPGFRQCLRHIPEDECDRAWELGHRRCKAHVKDETSPFYGERCGHAAVLETEFCQYHQKNLVGLPGGTKMQRYRLHKVSAEEGIDTTRVANPLQSLLELAAEEMALKDELKRRVVALKEDEWRYEGQAGEQIHGIIQLYERALDRTGRRLTALVRLGIEERLARVTERQARLVEAAVAGALADTGLPQDVQDRAREAAARRLRAVG